MLHFDLPVEVRAVQMFYYLSLSGAVMRALLLKHRHVNDHKQFQFGLRRNFSGYSSLLSLADDKPKPQKSVSFSIPYNEAHPTIDIVVKAAKEKDKTELDLTRNLVTPTDIQKITAYPMPGFRLT